MTEIPPAAPVPPQNTPPGNIPPGSFVPGGTPPGAPASYVPARRRRRSIFGPLVLIVIGVLFLLHHAFPYLHFGYLFRAYWPLLLIAWGLIKLFENVSARRSGDTSRPFMSGGEVAVLVVFLVFAGLVFAFDRIHERFPDVDFGDTWSESGSPITEDLPVQKVSPNAPISINTPRGDITVFADEDNELRVIATKTVRSSSEDESRRRGRQITVTMNATNGGWDILPSVPSSGRRARIDFEVHLPKKVSLALQTGNGDINVNGVQGTINATSLNGSLEIRDSKGNVTGTVQKGDVRMSNIEGDVHLQGHGNDVSVSGVKGNADIDGDFLGSIEVDNVSEATRFNSSRTDLSVLRLQGRLEMDSGSLQISDVTGNVKLNTRNRDIEIDNVVGRIDLTDAHGDISVSLKKAPKDEITIANES
ncbi:MAG: DUF4097 family beta strand repeat protein, partial [Phycisphaerae bacterium]|nr:DUF4097 family beta strand repeat protein [Phycisphaerae bacterium]